MKFALYAAKPLHHPIQNFTNLTLPSLSAALYLIVSRGLKRYPRLPHNTGCVLCDNIVYIWENAINSKLSSKLHFLFNYVDVSRGRGTGGSVRFLNSGSVANTSTTKKQRVTLKEHILQNWTWLTYWTNPQHKKQIPHLVGRSHRETSKSLASTKYFTLTPWLFPDRR